MTTADEQRDNVAAFLAASDATPGLTLAEWRQRVSWQKATMGVDVRVGALRKLLDEHEELLARVAKLDVCEALTERCDQTGEPLTECGCFECEPEAAAERAAECEAAERRDSAKGER